MLDSQLQLHQRLRRYVCGGHAARWPLLARGFTCQQCMHVAIPRTFACPRPRRRAARRPTSAFALRARRGCSAWPPSRAACGTSTSGCAPRACGSPRRSCAAGGCRQQCRVPADQIMADLLLCGWGWGRASSDTVPAGRTPQLAHLMLPAQCDEEDNFAPTWRPRHIARDGASAAVGPHGRGGLTRAGRLLARCSLAEPPPPPPDRN